MQQKLSFWRQSSSCQTLLWSNELEEKHVWKIPCISFLSFFLLKLQHSILLHAPGTEYSMPLPCSKISQILPISSQATGLIIGRAEVMQLCPALIGWLTWGQFSASLSHTRPINQEGCCASWTAANSSTQTTIKRAGRGVGSAHSWKGDVIHTLARQSTAVFKVVRGKRLRYTAALSAAGFQKAKNYGMFHFR